MATTRIIPMHINKGKTIAQCLKARVDYVKNPDKTAGGALISAYACSPETADQEFLLARSAYMAITGRKIHNEVIAYQLRQSFKPGEVTPEEANKIGYELASQFLKGEHAFIVATHNDRRHVHNHIVFCATALDGSRKFRNVFRSDKVLAELSDQLCEKHGLSVIACPQDKAITYDQWLGENAGISQRDILRMTIDAALRMRPDGFDALMQLLEEAVLEQRGEKAPQRTECSADLTVSANLPESYIPSGEQRMDIYRRIAALRTAEQSQELLDELIDRYGEPPPPVLRLMDVALLRAEAMQIGVCDIAQRGSEISFTFAGADAVPVNAVMALCSLPKNRRRLTLSATGTEPKLLLRLTPNEDALDTALTLVGDLRVNKEENEKEVTL